MVPEIWENVDPSRSPTNLCNEFSIMNVEVLWFAFVLTSLPANEAGLLQVTNGPANTTSFNFHLSSTTMSAKYSSQLTRIGQLTSTSLSRSVGSGSSFTIVHFFGSEYLTRISSMGHCDGSSRSPSYLRAFIVLGSPEAIFWICIAR